MHLGLRRALPLAVCWAGLACGSTEDRPGRADDARSLSSPALIWAETQKLHGQDDNGGNDAFGDTLDLEGSSAIVGSSGDQAGSDVGAAHVFVRVGATWQLQQILLPPNPLPWTYFGHDVVLSGDTAVSVRRQGSSGVFGGAAHVFVRQGQSWSEQIRFDQPSAAVGDTLHAAALDGDGLVLAGTTGVFATYRAGVNWLPLEAIALVDATVLDDVAIDLSADTLVIGAPGNDDKGTDAGSVHVLVRSGPGWTLQDQFEAPVPQNTGQFGAAVAIDGDRLVVGEPGASSFTGAAYVYERSGNSWALAATLTLPPSDPPQSFDALGRAVDLSGDRIVVSASGDDEQAPGAGAAHVFNYDGASWVHEGKLVAQDGQENDALGSDVAVSADQAFVGARLDDDHGLTSGSAYMFRLRSENGDSCVEASDCASQQCVDGVCCDTPCAAVCESCAQPGFEGVCTAIARGNDPEDECPDGSCLDAGVCGLDDGKPCLTAAECVSDQCEDGVCCDRACPACEACTAAKKGSGSDGVCGDIAVDTDPDDDCVASPTYPESCGADGLCDGLGACRTFAKPQTACGTTTCGGLAGNDVVGFLCSGGGQCQESRVSCAPYVCSTDRCTTSCAANVECAPGAFCNAAGSCEDRRPAGDSCGRGDECGSGFCVDGHCCNTPCEGQCEACGETGSEGSCVPVNGAPRGVREACPSGEGVCDEAACDGVARFECRAFSVEICAPASCLAGELRRQARCDGAGRCLENEPESCGAYRCADDATSCLEACAADADCRGGTRCVEGECLAAASCDPNGESRIDPGGQREDCAPYRCRAGDCLTRCESTADCAPGASCDSENVCRLATRSTKSGGGGCSSSGQGARGFGQVALLVLGLGLLGWRRRRPASVALLGAVGVLGCGSQSPPPSAVETRAEALMWGQVDTFYGTFSGDFFATSLSFDGTNLLVGNPQDDDKGSASGSAFLYELQGDSFQYRSKWLGMGTTDFDRFGQTVVIDGDRAALATSDLDSIGRVYVFEKSAGSWSGVAQLSGFGNVQDYYGSALALDGDTLVVGAPGDAEAGQSRGAVYIYTGSGASWQLQDKLMDAATRGRGRDVALEGDTLLVADDLASASGQVLELTRSLGVWSVTQALPNQLTDSNQFGISIALDGDTVAVADRDERVQVFTKAAGVWWHEQTLTGQSDSGFGVGLALDGDRLLVGAHDDSTQAAEAGAAFTFTRAAGVWSEEQQLLPSDGLPNDDFGLVAALRGGWAIVGARSKDLSDTQFDWGAAYTFALREDDGTACALGSDCASGFCVDGVCCDAACDASCQRCNDPQALGTCTAIAQGEDPDDECAAGACRADGSCGADLGLPCSSAADCTSDVCADGVCCDRDCASCEACTAVLKGQGGDGECGAVAADTDPHDACAQDAGFPISCLADGACDGAGFCRSFAKPGVACGATSCSSGEVSGTVCDGAGNCLPSMTVRCEPYLCAGDSCASVCSADSECASGAFCLTSACVALKKNGAPCARAGECESALCVDGVCCNQACDGQCEHCAEPGAAGTCIVVGGLPRGGRPPCPLGSGVCGQASCDGTDGSRCAGFPGPAISCASPSCSEGRRTPEGRCDGEGGCDVPDSISCGNSLECAPDEMSCLTACGADDDCRGDKRCDVAAGLCVVPARCDDAGLGIITADGQLRDCQPYRCDAAAVDAQCFDACGSTAECAPGYRCNAAGACVVQAAVASTGGSEGGCGVSPGARRAAPGWMALALLGWGLSRRRRRSAARRSRRGRASRGARFAPPGRVSRS